MDVAYGPLVEELERRLRQQGVRLPTPGPGQGHAAYKRALLTAAASRLGLQFLEDFGRELARANGHPFVAALVSAPSPAQLLLRWGRLELLAHSHNRIEPCEVLATGVTLRRTTVVGGAPTVEEDRLIMGFLAGALAAVAGWGVQVIALTPEGAEASGRLWALRWSPGDAASVAPAPASPATPWGTDGDFSRATIAILLEDPALPLAHLARRLGVSARSLQRRMRDAGASYSALVRIARVARAGASIVGDTRSEASLTAVAHACGFADSAHLSRDFRRLVGVAPRQFVASIRR